MKYDWSEEAMLKRNFLHYHAHRIFRASVNRLHQYEDETSEEKSRKILEKGG